MLPRRSQHSGLPCCREPVPKRAPETPDRTPDYAGRRTLDPDSGSPTSTVWPTSAVLVTRLHRSPATIHPNSRMTPSITVPRCRYPLGSFARYSAFPGSDYYDPSAPSRSVSRRRACPPKNRWPRSPMGETRWFPRSLLSIRDRRWPALLQRPRHGYAAGIHRGLPIRQDNPSEEFPEPAMRDSGAHRKPAHIHRVWSWHPELEELYDTGSSRPPLSHAHRTRTIRQYWHVPTSSGLLSALPGVSRIRLPSATAIVLRHNHFGVIAPPTWITAPRGAHRSLGRRGRPVGSSGSTVTASS